MMARKATLPLPTHSGKLFTWTGNKGVVEASTLGRSFSGRVWNDACDTGFDVVGRMSIKTFVYEAALSHSGDVSDVYGFRYKSLDGTCVIDVLNT